MDSFWKELSYNGAKKFREEMKLRLLRTFRNYVLIFRQDFSRLCIFSRCCVIYYH